MDERITTKDGKKNDSNSDVLEILGSHWNRKTRNDDTSIRWNSRYGKWECKVVRHLGFYENSEDAGRVMRQHLESSEAHFLNEMIENDNREMISGVMDMDRHGITDE